jgi:hypothetical protein
MTAEKFADEALRTDPRIRYVGIVDNQFHILLSRMREGIQSIASDEEERNFVQIMPPIIVDALEKFDYVTARYEKVLLVFFRMEGLIVILSFNPDVSTPFMSSLSESMKRLGSLYLL